MEIKAIPEAKPTQCPQIPRARRDMGRKINFRTTGLSSGPVFLGRAPATKVGGRGRETQLQYPCKITGNAAGTPYAGIGSSAKFTQTAL